MTRQIHVGDVAVGGGAPVSIQSMLNTRTTDVAGSLAQIARLRDAGCQIARLAVPDRDAAAGFAEIAAESPLPLVADIHFDWRLAILAAEGGAKKIRINPGNIGDAGKVRAVADCCRERGIPIRVGVNAGSLEKSLLEKYGLPHELPLTGDGLAQYMGRDKKREGDTLHAVLLRAVGEAYIEAIPLSALREVRL